VENDIQLVKHYLLKTRMIVDASLSLLRQSKRTRRRRVDEIEKQKKKTDIDFVDEYFNRLALSHVTAEGQLFKR